MEENALNQSISPKDSKGEFIPSIQSLSQENVSEKIAIDIPKIELPKGGGALKGIDEKFEVNPSNGTASFSIPIPLTPGRSGFTPPLSLSYNSGAGNGWLGIGWSLNYPSIQRKTDKKLPRYQGEDTFSISGSEDLVPYLRFESGSWNKEEKEVDEFSIKRYRPRIESSFSRIEQITHSELGVYWKVTSRDNKVSFYGYTKESRIADPKDPSKIFKWLPCFSYDKMGNWIIYEYKAEDLNNIEDRVSEKNRTLENTTNIYLKRVKYGNHSAWYPFNFDINEPGAPEQFAPTIPDDDFHFECVIDYGEHTDDTPIESSDWSSREDVLSSFRSGFDIRIYRQIQRILMFHHFPDEQQKDGSEFGKDYLVRSMSFDYEPSSINESGQTEVSYLKSITQIGYIRKPDKSYSTRSLPPLEFKYQNVQWNHEVRSVSNEDLQNLPSGLSNNYQWVDLFGEGVPGILKENDQGWYYKENLGTVTKETATFGASRMVLEKPSFQGLENGSLVINDLEADGSKQISIESQQIQGYFNLNSESKWEGFLPKLKQVNLDLSDPYLRRIDLNGDGKAELVLTEESALLWYPNLGKKGYDVPERSFFPPQEENGPAIVFNDIEQSIYLADMSGDGLTDVVRIRNGEVCYWANMGYGKFSEKITMSNSPYFDSDEHFNPAFIQIADLSGTGVADIIYLGMDKFQAYLNLSGNAWSEAHEIENTFPYSDQSKLSVIDLLATGTSCLVWSSSLPQHESRPLRYVDLMSSKKPHVLTSYSNNMGKVVTSEYTHSTHFYLKDKIEGNPWITKLPFPVQVVTKTIIEDKIAKSRFASIYSYHHGYYDHEEKEFRGFGRVEQLDSETFEEWEMNSDESSIIPKELSQDQVLTKTWFHTGVFFDRNRILTHFESEYWQANYEKLVPGSSAFIEPSLPDALIKAEESLPTDLVSELSSDEIRETYRACKGMPIRTEIFGLSASDLSEEQAQKEAVPYSVSTHNCHIQLLQIRDQNEYGVYMVTESEAVQFAYDQNPEDPRIAHTLNVKIDNQGNVLEMASVVYPRLESPKLSASDELRNEINGTEYLYEREKLTALSSVDLLESKQGQQHLSYSVNSLSDDLITDAHYRLRLPCESGLFEVRGIAAPSEGALLQLSDLENVLDLPEIPYYERYSAEGIRKLEHSKNFFLSEDLETALPFGEHAWHGLPHQAFLLSLTDSMQEHLDNNLWADNSLLDVGDSILENECGLSKESSNDKWWIRSGIAQYLNGDSPADARSRFLSPLAYQDQLGTESHVEFYKDYFMFLSATEDAMGNRTGIERFNFRTLSPELMFDMNDNYAEVIFNEWGLVKSTAVRGKILDASIPAYEADHLDGITEYTEEAELNEELDFISTEGSDELQNIGRTLLGTATSRFVYNFNRYKDTLELRNDQLTVDPELSDCGLVPVLPNVVSGIVREVHHAVLDEMTDPKPEDQRVQIGFEYSNGSGGVIMVKKQAEGGIAQKVNIDADCNSSLEEFDTKDEDRMRWIGNGRTILNNKGNPIKQFEPYFSTTPFFEDNKLLVEQGHSPTLYYDAVGRNLRTEFPDGTLTRIEFDSWSQSFFDQNDSVLESEWYTTRKTLSSSDPRHKAAVKSEVHANTPARLFQDSLGRTVMSLQHNKRRYNPGSSEYYKDEFLATLLDLDIESNALSITDARGNVVMSYEYNLLGHRIFQNSMDAGKRFILNDVIGNPIKRWDDREQIWSFDYDILHRPKNFHVKGGEDGPDHIYQKHLYGDEPEFPLADARARNIRGVLVDLYDTSGLNHTEQIDHSGNVTQFYKRLLEDFKTTPNYSESNPEGLLESEEFSFSTEYDALGRPTRLTYPDGSVTIRKYGDRGTLDQVEVIKETPLEQLIVESISYDAKGQRASILYGNGVRTKYTYDEKTYRLETLRTTRGSASEVLQYLEYTYDAVGNITCIIDHAQATSFFNGQQSLPKMEYLYDSIYQLTEGNGREMKVVVDHGSSDNWSDEDFYQMLRTGDTLDVRNYTQRYSYDGVGNIMEMKHIASGGSWTRTYTYESDNNRLIETQVGSSTYVYDHHAKHGYITEMPHLSIMDWNFRDELRASSKQHFTDAIPETTWYTYDASGQRARKVTMNEGGESIKEERIYLGDYETYRKSASTADLERVSLHVMDDQRRVAMIDTRLAGSDDSEEQTLRYQIGDHLGSAALELNESAEVISYEEYHPFGTTAFQFRNQDIRCTAKRYRYTGMERDEETGFNYHSARYLIVWLGRWLKPDPTTIAGGINLFKYSKNNPIKYDDSEGLAPRAHIDGEIGELALAQILEDRGYKTFVDSAKTVTTPGIDLVAFDPQSGELLVFDNKAYRGRVSEVSAFSSRRLITNLNEVTSYLEAAAAGGEEYAQNAIEALDRGDYRLIVSNLNSERGMRFSEKLFRYYGYEAFDGRTGKFYSTFESWTRDLSPILDMVRREGTTASRILIQLEEFQKYLPSVGPSILIGAAMTIPARADAAESGDLAAVIVPDYGELKNSDTVGDYTLNSAFLLEGIGSSGMYLGTKFGLEGGLPFIGMQFTSAVGLALLPYAAYIKLSEMHMESIKEKLAEPIRDQEGQWVNPMTGEPILGVNNSTY